MVKRYFAREIVIHVDLDPKYNLSILFNVESLIFSHLLLLLVLLRVRHVRDSSPKRKRQIMAAHGDSSDFFYVLLTSKPHTRDISMLLTMR